MSADDNHETEVLSQFERVGFQLVTCCDGTVGMFNPRPFTTEAGMKFEEIRKRHVSVEDPMGNSWKDDPAARELLADPLSTAPVADGYRFPFACKTCGAAFMFTGGAAVRIPRDVA